MMSSPKKSKESLPPLVVGQVNRDEYLVEKILEKKQEGGEWQYLIKWIGWPSETNTWEPRKNLNCDVMLSEFEKQWEIDNQAQMSPELTPTPDNPDNPAPAPDNPAPADKSESDMGSASESESESDYDSGEDENVSSEKTRNYLDYDILEECPADKEPKCVVGVVDLSGHLTYLIEWKKDEENVTEDENEEPDRNLIQSTPFKLKYPQVIIDYYVQHLNFATDSQSDGDAIAGQAAQALAAAREREEGEGGQPELEPEIPPTQVKSEFDNLNLDTSSDSDDEGDVYMVDN